MKIKEALQSLESSWSRDDVILKLKQGKDTDDIVNEFIKENTKDIQEIERFFNKNDKEFLNQLENFSICEAKLINKIKQLSNNKFKLNNSKYEKEENKVSSNKIGVFMMKWSNKFVFIVLLTISAIALSKQAWA